jgi:hypothetical protein
MNSELREQLLLRMFSSIEYMEDYVNHFVTFIDTGLAALEAYENLQPKPVGHPAYSDVLSDVRLWNLKVRPNFLGMKKNIIESIQNAKMGKLSTIRSAAGSFRGLSKDMDGIRESFMDFIDPLVKHKYFLEREITSTMGDNIYYTLSNYWDEGEILRETITGPIDEQALHKYMLPSDKS